MEESVWMTSIRLCPPRTTLHKMHVGSNNLGRKPPTPTWQCAESVLDGRRPGAVTQLPIRRCSLVQARDASYLAAVSRHPSSETSCNLPERFSSDHSRQRRWRTSVPLMIPAHQRCSAPSYANASSFSQRHYTRRSSGVCRRSVLGVADRGRFAHHSSPAWKEPGPEFEMGRVRAMLREKRPL